MSVAARWAHNLLRFELGGVMSLQGLLDRYERIDYL